MAPAQAARDAAPSAADGLGYRPFARKDDVPVCMFETYEEYEATSFVRDVKKKSVRLKPGRTLSFGTYAPGCASQDCVRRPTLQCWADLEGDTIVLNTRYSGEHRDESACTEHCEVVNAGCETPELAAGSYTLRYGERTLKLKVPSTVKPVCLATE